MTDSHKPNYYAILTADVRYDKRLSDGAKLLYAEITALCNMNGYCEALDSYFCRLYGVSQPTIQRRLLQLCKFGYIRRDIEYHSGTKNVKSRKITPTTPILKNEHTYTQKRVDPILKNEQENITPTESNNKKNYNKKISGKADKVIEGMDKPPKDWVDYAQSKKLRNILETFEAFKNYHLSKNSKFVDWNR